MNKELENDRPPFFKRWKDLYFFVFLFEVVLVVLFIWITNLYAA
tara:strand:+ start:863 stop:994 length:132 start_codon:yes stop_codon:yes gene_type:complete